MSKINLTSLKNIFSKNGNTLDKLHAATYNPDKVWRRSLILLIILLCLAVVLGFYMSSYFGNVGSPDNIGNSTASSNIINIRGLDKFYKERSEFVTSPNISLPNPGI